MGHRKRSAPRRGSLGVRPRKRARDIIPRVRSWPAIQSQEVKLLGFMGYKVGMTHALIVDDRPGSPTEGKEIFTPITVVETPPMLVAGIRLYGYDPNRGLYSLHEVWSSKDVLESVGFSRLNSSFNPPPIEKALEKAEGLREKVREVRALMLAQPRLAGGVPKKTPELLEIALSGNNVDSKFEFLKEMIGKTVRINQVFTAGMFIDTISVTKGKGFQGVIKRFGAKELPRWHKHRKASRTVGSRGSRVGALSSTPQAGQMGFHQRVDYNKRIIMIGVVEEGKEDPREIINPVSGWHKYGLVKTDFVVLAGSIPGPRKRPVVLRYPIRKIPWEPKGAPKITYLHINPGKQ